MYRIEISPRTIVFTVFFLLGLQLLWMVKELVLSLLLAFILMSALDPWVSALKKRRVPRAVSAVAIYVLLIFLLGYLFSWIIPPVAEQTGQLFRSLPYLAKRLNPNLGQYFAIDYWTKNLPILTSNAFLIVREVFSNLLLILSTIFFSLYLLIDQDLIKRFVLRFVNKKDEKKFAAILDRSERKMRAWFWGEIILMITIGTMTFVGLNLIGVPYALPLAIIAGLLEIIPFFGPVISAIPAFIVASASTLFLGVVTVFLYFVVQQLENQIVVPLVMRRVVGLNPIVTLVVLIIGGTLFGLLGVFLAIPLTLLIEIIATEFYFQ